jgi:hypothetical protein
MKGIPIMNLAAVYFNSIHVVYAERCGQGLQGQP